MEIKVWSLLKSSFAVFLILISFLMASQARSACLDQVSATALRGCDRIRLVVGVTPGGASDVFARDIASYLHADVGLTVVVENKTGATGHIAAQLVASAKSTECVAMVGTASSLYLNSFNPNLVPKLDPLNGFRHIGLIATNPMFLVVNTKNVPVSSVAEFVEHFSSRQGAFATPGIGSSNHFVALRMAADLNKFAAGGADFVHVPTRGASEAMNLLLGGNVDFTFENPSTARAAIGSAKIAIIGNTSSGRVKIAGVDSEPLNSQNSLSGTKGFSAFGLVAPKAMPETMAKAFGSGLRCFLQDRSMRSKYENDGYTMMSGTQGEMASWIGAELREWSLEAKTAYNE